MDVNTFFVIPDIDSGYITAAESQAKQVSVIQRLSNEPAHVSQDLDHEDLPDLPENRDLSQEIGS